MRSRRAATMAFALPMLAAAACGSGGGGSGGAAPATVAPSPTAVARAVVSLDDAGAEPRRPLVLRHVPGSSTRVAVVNKLSLKITVGGQAMPVGAVPATRMVIEQRVDRVDTDGTAYVSTTFPEVSVLPSPGVDAATVEATQAQLDALKGVSGKATVNARGEVTDVTFDTSRITDPTLKASLDPLTSQIGNLSAPFPAEPVGVGARWTAVSTTTLAGLRMTTTTRYTVRSRSGDNYELDHTQDAVAVPGPAAFPNLPAGSQASVTKFNVRTTGQTSGDLTRHLPVRSSSTGTGEGAFTVTAGVEKTTFLQQMAIDLTMSPA